LYWNKPRPGILIGVDAGVAGMGLNQTGPSNIRYPAKSLIEPTCFKGMNGASRERE